MKKLKNNFSAILVVAAVLLIIYFIILCFVSVWALYTSFKSNLDFLGNKLGLPEKIKWSNFATALEYYMVEINDGENINNVYIETMFLYSVLYAGGSAFASAFVSCVVAYVTQKFNFRFNKVIYGIVIVTMTLPIVGNLPSELQLLRTLGLYDHIWGMWICKANFLGMYYLVFFAAFSALSSALFEAAYMDGASELRVMFEIALPLVKNVFFTIFLIKFVEFWNDYTVTITYMPSIPTIAFGLYEYSMSAKPAINNTPMRLAACFVVIIPLLVVFLIFKDRFMGNISMGGVKE